VPSQGSIRLNPTRTTDFYGRISSVLTKALYSNSVRPSVPSVLIPNLFASQKTLIRQYSIFITPVNLNNQSMTIILTPYWSNGVQKLKMAAQRMPIFLSAPKPLWMRYVAPHPPKHGLVPPVLNADIHTQRCLAQLRSKDKNIEKYIYLSHLKHDDPPMFYKLCLKHMAEITPIIYTPTVGDACMQFSHIYRRPEGLVCIFHPPCKLQGTDAIGLVCLHQWQRKHSQW